MNATIHKHKQDFIVLKDSDIENKYFIYNFEEGEYLTENDGLIPIQFNSRFDAYKYVNDAEVIHNFKQLPKYIKMLIR